MNKVKKNKKVTTEQLAVMVAKGFEGVGNRFDKVEGRLSKIEDRMDRVEEGVKDIRLDIFNLGDRFVSYHAFDSLARRVKVLETKRR
jgi:seryl-tRNA synthetase